MFLLSQVLLYTDLWAVHPIHQIFINKLEILIITYVTAVDIK